MPTNTTRSLPLLCLLSLFACGDPAAVGDRGDRGPGGKGDLPGSCLSTDGDFCGDQSSDGCWCDALCEDYGDCCGDKADVCECRPASCDGQCGTIDDGCGGTLECGPCACGEQACTALGAECGSLVDACGDLQHCGQCSGASVCGGAGVPNECACVSGDWTLSSIDDDAWVGNVAIAADSDGGLHIAYYDGKYDALRYGYSADGQSWSTETVDAEDDAGYELAIAVDDDHGVHISYTEREPLEGELRYAYRPAGGDWSLEVIDGDGPIGATSIAVDAAGGVHVGYSDCHSYEATYAFRAPGGGWSTKAVDDTGNCDPNVALAVDPSGGVHMSYQRSYELRYAYRAPGLPWSTELVEDSGQSDGAHNAIAVSDAGGVFIAYQSISSGGYRSLDLARKPADGSWSTDDVSDSDWTGMYPSIAIDAGGGIHIAQVDHDEDEPQYLYSGDGGASFATDVVDTEPLVASSTSVAVDPSGGVHLVYHSYLGGSGADGDLGYAYRCP